MSRPDDSARGSGSGGGQETSAQYATADLNRVDDALAGAVSSDGHPKMVGRYQLIECVGEGGMGSVFRAQQHSPIERVVALKLIKLGLGSPEVVRRFESERQALAWMDHPNIAKVLDAGADPFTGQPYFVMDFVTGRPITEYCDEQRMNNRDRLGLFLQVCDAVAHAHQKMVVHRDLKPSNILVSSANGPQTAHAKIIDFGIAKALVGRQDGRTMFTQSGQMVGTPEYMSPEQARSSGADDVDTRSDIYSLGVVLYELLTGALPFDPKTLRSSGLAGIERMICEVDPPRPSTRLSSLGDTAGDVAGRRQTDIAELSRQLKSELEWIPLKAMRKDRSQRYATVIELADDIRNYLAGRPLTAAPESRVYRTKKLLRRNRVPVTIALLVTLLLIGGIVGTSWQAIRAERQRKLAEARFNDIRELSSNLIFDIHDDVAKLAGSQPAVDKLLGIALRYLQKLNADASENSGVLVDAAFGYQGLGAMQQKARNSKQGGVKAAETSFEKSRDLAQRAVAMAPQDPNARTALARAQMRLADLASGRGDYAAALTQYREALAVLEQLARAEPGNVKRRGNVAQALLSIALAQQGSRATTDAIQAYERTIEWARAVCADFPQDADVRDTLAMALLNLTDMHVRTGNLDAALTTAREGLKSHEAGIAADPENVGRHVSLAQAFETLARVYEQRGQLEEAIGQQERGLTIATAMLGKDPGNASVLRTLGHIQVRFAELTGRAKRFDEARRAYDQAIATYGKVLDFTPDDMGSRRMRLYAIASLGDMLGRQERFDEAVAYHRQAIATLESMLAAAPNDPALAGGMAYSCVNAGIYLKAAGDPRAATELLRRAIGLQEKLVKTDPANAFFANNLIKSYEALGEALFALELRPESHQQFVKAHAAALELFKQNRLDGGRSHLDGLESKLAESSSDNPSTTAPATQP